MPNNNNQGDWDVISYEDSLNPSTLQYQVFQILKDCQWHCRTCAQKIVNTQQYAGGGGIQGLQRGTRTRPGIVIESATAECSDCHEVAKCDRWTGEFQSSNSASGIPQGLQDKIFEYYQYTDVIEQRRRTAHDLVIDHRLPMERWGTAEDANSINMTEDEINQKFQLLKKDASGNHNLLKSRACERCIASGKRGYPMGIKYYYAGDENWPIDCPTSGPGAERGCYGCGWYDLETWRESLNEHLSSE